MAQTKKKTTDIVEVLADCETHAASPNIENMIYNFRGVQVMIDHDLAMLYGVKTKVLNQAVNRNIERFLNGFDSNCLKMRQMNWSQIVTGCET